MCQGLMRIVAGDATDAPISLFPALAVLEPVGCEPHVEDSQIPAAQNVFPCTMASAAEVDGIDTVQTRGIKNQGSPGHDVPEFSAATWLSPGP